PGVGPEGEVGERELARLAGPARLRPGLVDRGRAGGEHVRRATAHEPAVAEQRDPAEAGFGRAAEDEFGAAGPNRLGPDRAGVTIALTGPDPLHLGQLLIKAPPLAGGRQRAGGEVVVAAAQAEAEHQAPSGEPVERG